MSENTELWEKVNSLTATVATTVARIDDKFLIHRAEEREWVRQIIDPIEKAVTRMEGVVASLSDDAKSLFAMHDAILKKWSAAEEKKREDRTATGLVKKYAPLLGAILGLVALFKVAGNVLGSVAETWLKSHGF